jgi:phenylalanyl-tRNA synthetase beta chain
MKILTPWLRAYLPNLPVTDRELAEALTLRGIAVEGEHPLLDAGAFEDNGTPEDRGAGTLFEMDITTNRVDAMNHYGIAREIAAIYGVLLMPLDRSLPAMTGDESYPVRIDPAAAHLCGRFTARVLRGVTVGTSRGLVAEYFAHLGQRPISNAVDATNYTLLAMGHPTHAFDLDTLEGGLVVRLAKPGETLLLLDGTERTLAADDLVVADERKALGLAGVMGGMASSITAQTKNVLVEAAWFDPATIRRSARRHGLHTDASHRFERGADFDAAPVANDLVAQLILAQCGGSLAGPLVDVVEPELASRTSQRPPITLSTAEVRRRLGTTLDPAGLTTPLIERFLTALGCSLTPVATSDSSTPLPTATPNASPTATPNASLIPSPSTPPNASSLPQQAAASSAADSDTFSVTLPSWRLDLERPIDLIEEIARVYGYNGFANTLPRFSGGVVAHPDEPASAAVRQRLLALGWSETVSSTFTSTAEAAHFAPQTMAVPMENPLSEEAGLLRPSLLPGMVAMLALNLNRDVAVARAFEAGTVFSASAEEHSAATRTGLQIGLASKKRAAAQANAEAVEAVHERTALVLGLTGTDTNTPRYAAAEAPFYQLKGAAESLVSLFALTTEALNGNAASALAFSATDLPQWIEPGRGAVVLLSGEPLGVLGQLATTEQTRRKLRQPVWLAELDLASLLALPLRRTLSRELSRFQAVTRDFSFLFSDATTWGEIEAAIHALNIAELRSLAPAEIFRDPKGKAVPAGQYSILVETVFQSADRTLQDAELTGWSQSIVAALSTLGGQQRA